MKLFSDTKKFINNKILKKVKKKPIFLVLIFLILGASGTAYYFWNRTADYKQNPRKAAEEDVEDTISRVSRLIVLPEGEEPTVATVSDPEQLKNQPFFAKAKKGDKVLIFANIGKVILYDPVIDKIIDVATVNTNVAEEINPTETPEPEIQNPKETPQETPAN